MPQAAEPTRLNFVTDEHPHRPTHMLTRIASTATRVVVRQRPRPLAHLLRSGSSQTVRSTTALIDPALLSRDDSSKAGPALHAAENLDALLRGDTKKPNAQNEFTETAVADAPQLHGRYASIAAPRAQTIAQTIPQPEFTEVEAADHAWRQTWSAASTSVNSGCGIVCAIVCARGTAIEA